jgi:hypothetical protein
MCAYIEAAGHFGGPYSSLYPMQVTRDLLILSHSCEFQTCRARCEAPLGRYSKAAMLAPRTCPSDFLPRASIRNAAAHSNDRS